MDMSTLRQNLKPTVWGAILGAVALVIVGFNWGGWSTSGSSQKMAAAAVVDALIPICIGQFNADSDKTMKLAQMIEAGKWKQTEYVMTSGWATMPGSDKAERDVASGCATVLAS